MGEESFIPPEYWEEDEESEEDDREPEDRDYEMTDEDQARIDNIKDANDEKFWHGD